MIQRFRTSLHHLLSACFAACLCVSARAQQLPPLTTADQIGAEIYKHTASEGLVLVVVRDGDVYMQSYGVRGPGSKEKPGADSLIRLCSLSKIMATDLLVKLAVDNKIAFTDPLQKFAPEGVTVPTRTVRGPALRPLTIGDLATHTAGLPREIAYPAKDEAHFTFPDFAYRWQWLPTYSLRTSPGVAAHYSNIGFDLLGDALARAAGKPYAQLFQERTATPLGLNDTTLTPTREQCSRLLIGAKSEGACTDTQAAAGSGGMYSTANDMVRWLQYLLSLPGVPVHQNPAALAVYLLPTQLRSIQGLNHTGQPTGLGLGWVRLGEPDAANMMMSKTGGGAGFLTYIALSPSHHAGVFLAATEGRSHIGAGANLFHEANDLLAWLTGVPLLPQEPKAEAEAETEPEPKTPVATRRHKAAPAHKAKTTSRKHKSA